MAQDWKDRLGVVFSTNPDFDYEHDEEQEEDTLAPEDQRLTIKREKKGRKGKTVCLIGGFVGSEEDLKALATQLKTKFGVGGSVTDGEIILQGDFAEKVKTYLESQKYKVKKIGG